ncbi:long-chain-fatty-acid--CoA ligase ACSBG2-like [Protopterus annectens]|uniref:long-chain-fatty-acid--CoA ligase ACSBG2-like n=1 Tax=Protopterus annectens TaxID=7888 RepID=UPI001CFA334A|nr:long-chain-fatty-acid--CoA ligase ACSBG2-like [Protopterus annectens]
MSVAHLQLQDSYHYLCDGVQDTAVSVESSCVEEVNKEINSNRSGEVPLESESVPLQINGVKPKTALSGMSSDLRLWTTLRDGEVNLRIGETGNAALPPITVHELFLQAVEKYGDFVAVASKKGEQWNKLTYKQYYAECRRAAKGFLKLGLERYHGVGILGFNSQEWFIADVAAILAGGFAVGIYTTNSPEACLYCAENSDCNILVVENQKQLKKILEVQDNIPNLKAIIVYSDEMKEKRPNIYSWSEFIELGKDVPDSQLDDIIASQKPNQCCTLIYTSGTTGQPKGVMLSHDNLTWTAHTAGKTVGLKDALEFQETVVSYLPLSHIAAQMIDIWLPMKFGGATYFAQPDALKGSLVVTLKEVRPTAFMGVPRVWEKMQEKMKSVGAKSSTVRRKVAAWAKDVGLHTNLKRMNGQATLPLNYHVAKKLVFKKVRKALGLDRCTKCYTGAAPITKETLEFFLSLDIPVYELYGMSECTGPHTVSVPSAFRLTSCGKVMCGCETKIHQPDSDKSGEICFWGRHVFMGYLNMLDKTEESLDKDGWLHSGDLGKHDQNGFLYITGRIKELIITAGGENIPPVPIEDAVKEQVPIISNAMLIGDKRKFLSMILTLKSTINEDTGEPEDILTPEAVEYCKNLGSKATRVSDIVGGKDKTIYTAIQEGINVVNDSASSNAQKIQKWTILDKDFSLSGGELGPTMKLKRPVVLKMYNEIIDAFYNDAVTPVTAENPLPPK